MTLEQMAEVSSPSETRIRALKGGVSMYYREPHRGHILSASAQKMDVSNFVERGWRHLPKYGHHVADHITINHPLDELFRKGGAKELPVSQLIEENFAYPVWGDAQNEWYKVDGAKVEFPQLVGATVPPLEDCPFCPRRGTHAQVENHKEVMHQKDLAPLAMGEILGKILKGEAPVNEQMQDIVQQATAFPCICGKCGEGFKGHMQLAKHIKEHKNDA